MTCEVISVAEIGPRRIGPWTVLGNGDVLCPHVPGTLVANLLLESGGSLLLEDGGVVLLEKQ